MYYMMMMMEIQIQINYIKIDIENEGSVVFFFMLGGIFEWSILDIKAILLELNITLYQYK